MIVVKALVTVAVSTLLSAAVGAGVGYALGRYAPSFCLALLPRRPGEPLDPVEVGLGLGLSQGLIWGVVIGLVVVAVVAWHDTRIAAARGKADARQSPPGSL